MPSGRASGVWPRSRGSSDPGGCSLAHGCGQGRRSPGGYPHRAGSIWGWSLASFSGRLASGGLSVQNRLVKKGGERLPERVWEASQGNQREGRADSGKESLGQSCGAGVRGRSTAGQVCSGGAWGRRLAKSSAAREKLSRVGAGGESRGKGGFSGGFARRARGAVKGLNGDGAVFRSSVAQRFAERGRVALTQVPGLGLKKRIIKGSFS